MEQERVDGCDHDDHDAEPGPHVVLQLTSQQLLEILVDLEPLEQAVCFNCDRESSSDDHDPARVPNQLVPLVNRGDVAPCEQHGESESDREELTHRVAHLLEDCEALLADVPAQTNERIHGILQSPNS